jgi:quercetin dioxygenase-like cupin family protein
MAGPGAIAVCGGGPQLDLLRGPGSAQALVHPGVGATMRAMHHLVLEGDCATVGLNHPSDAVYYVLSGAGRVSADGQDLSLAEGAMIHIDAGTPYWLHAGPAGMAVVGGPAPADPGLYDAGAPPPAAVSASDRGGTGRAGVRLFHRDRPDLLMPLISSDARLVIWPGVGALAANMNYVKMAPGEENVPHVHPVSEDTIYIVEGRGSVRNVDDDTVQEFRAGDAIFVPAGVQHQVRADAGVPVVSVGGPCPPDYEMLRRLGAEF